MMRYLPDVINEILVVVPESETELIKSLTSILSSARYAAPELQIDWWMKTADVLYARFGSGIPTEEWGDTIGKIWIDTK